MFKALSAGDSPDDLEGEDGLERLQGLILDIPGLLHNARWCEEFPTSAYSALEGQRIKVSDVSVVVTLPTTVSLYGDTRAPRDLARIHILPPATNAGLWVYSATNGSWARVDALTLDGEFPFGPEDVEGVKAQLASRFVDEIEGLAISGTTSALASRSISAFRSRFRKPWPEHSELQDYR